MTCRAYEEETKIQDDIHAILLANMNSAEALKEQLEKDFSCIEYPTTRIVRKWYKLWLPNRVKIFTKPSFSIIGGYSDGVKCTFGDLKTVVWCDTTSKNNKYFVYGENFKVEDAKDYDSLFKNFIEALVKYRREFELGKYK